MRLFAPIYDKVMQWAEHPKAAYYLAAVSFMESSFFPIPVAFMLAPMAAAKPKLGLRYATIATIASVLGGLFGYCIGYFAFELAQPWIVSLGYQEKFELAKSWFEQWGFVALFVAGFSPIPYKIFTVAAGSVSMAILPFILASLVGRSGQFFFIGAGIYFFGEKYEPLIRKYIEILGWLMVVAVVLIYLYLKVLSG